LGLSSVKTLKTNAVLYEDLMGGRSLRSSNSGPSTTYQHDEPVYSQPTESNYGGANYNSSTPTAPEPSASSEPPASSAPASTPAPTPSASSADHPTTSASSE
jgi:transcriptional attenuator lytR, putative